MVDNTPGVPFLERPSGRALRWALYVPVGFVVLVILQGLAAATFHAIFDNLRDFVLIGIILGMVGAVPIFTMIYFGAVVAVGRMCPSPRGGMTAFGILYGLFGIANLASGRMPILNVVVWIGALAVLAWAVSGIRAAFRTP